MMRKAVWSTVGLAAFLTLATAWFLENYDRVPVKRWEAPGEEALRDPYLALDRFLDRLGRPLTRIRSSGELAELTSGGVLLLDSGRRLAVNAERAERLLQWVSDGGYLIVAAEDSGIDDPLLDRLNIERASPDTEETDDSKKGADTEAGRCSVPGNESEPDGILPIPLPDKAGTTARLEDGGDGPALKPGSPAPAWSAGPAADCRWVVHYVMEKGAVTVFRSLDFLSNWKIGEHEHAKLIWTLIGHYQPSGEVRLANRIEVTTLWRWLWEQAWCASISVLLLVAFWLWAVVPRFGGVLPEPEPPRRSLREHLAAAGRAVWREGGIQPWIAVLRTGTRDLMLRRHPHLAALEGDQRAETFASLAGVDASRLAVLLAPDQAGDERDFIELARTQQCLERNL